MESLKEYTRILKAVADPSRTRILKLLEERELCVCQIMAVIGLKQPTISKHLSILKKAGLVETRRNGTWIHYSVSRRRRNDYDQVQLALMRNWLNDDAAICADRARLKEILKKDIRELCGT